MKSLLQSAGVKVLAAIEDNIRNGVDYNGNPFEYSKKPFWRPFDEALYNRFGGSEGKGKLFEVSTRNGTDTGLVFLGGYDEFKKKMYPNSYPYFLTVTGKLLRSMKVLSSDDNQAIIGFTGQRNQQLAFWLNVSGAGRGRKLWKFLGISEKQKVKIIGELSAEARELYVEKINAMINNTGLNH